MLAEINRCQQPASLFAPRYPRQVFGSSFDAETSQTVRKPTAEEVRRLEASVSVIGQKGSCTVYRFLNGQSEAGYMTSYKVFPGIMLCYNEFAMKWAMCDSQPHEDLIEINHCREGRYECQLPDGRICYIGKGDLSVHRRSLCPQHPSFPFGYYHGISVLVDLPKVEKKLRRQLTELGIDLDKLPRILRLDDAPFLFRATERIEHIFSEIYEIQDAYRQTYLKIKVLELFYFIYHACEDTLFQLRSPNIQRKHVQKIKRIQEYITEHIDRHITVRQLSQQFSLSETSIKTGFKSLYGTSIGSYLRTYRMHVAAGRLSAGEMSVLEVALSVGYENPSKFAAVFRTETGKAPLEYQKQMFLGSEVVPFELPQIDALNVRNAARSDRIPVRME